MLNKNRKFWEEVDNFLTDNYMDGGKIIDDYSARFYERPKAAYITNVNPMILAAAIIQAYDKDNLLLEDYLEDITKLSFDDFGKDDKIYY